MTDMEMYFQVFNGNESKRMEMEMYTYIICITMLNLMLLLCNWNSFCCLDKMQILL